jgi:transposase
MDLTRDNLVKLMRFWRYEIGRMWFSKTNGIMEGLQKMEMIRRRAFGFRSFNKYRLRVLTLCGWNGIIELENS